MTADVSLVLVDDHPLVRSGLRALLESEPDLRVVGEAGDGVEAIDVVLRVRPDLVLMDLQMPRMGGVASIRAILEAWPDARVLVLTTYDTDEAILTAVEAGASGYLLKDADTEVLADGVRRAAAGDTVLSPPVARRLVDRVRQPDALALSVRELEVLREVARGASNADIAARLHISAATVKTHLLHIYDKLAVNDRAAAVSRAYQRRLLTPDDD